MFIKNFEIFFRLPRDYEKERRRATRAGRHVRRPVMPFIHVRYATPLEKDLRQPIAAFLTETTARVLGKKPRSPPWPSSRSRPPTGSSAAAPSPITGKATFFVEVRVTRGTNVKEEKAAYLREVFAGLQSLLGPVDPDPTSTCTRPRETRTATAASRRRPAGCGPPPSRWRRPGHGRQGQGDLARRPELALQGHRAEVVAGRRRPALQGVEVHVVQAEARPPALEPLEVVQQRPVEVAAHVDARRPRLQHRGPVPPRGTRCRRVPMRSSMPFSVTQTGSP